MVASQIAHIRCLPPSCSEIRRPPSSARGKNAERRVERPRPCEHPVEIGQRKQRRDRYERDARQYCVAELTPRHPEQRASANRTFHAPTAVRRLAPVTLASKTGPPENSGRGIRRGAPRSAPRRLVHSSPAVRRPRGQAAGEPSPLGVLVRVDRRRGAGVVSDLAEVHDARVEDADHAAVAGPRRSRRHGRRAARSFRGSPSRRPRARCAYRIRRARRCRAPPAARMKYSPCPVHDTAHDSLLA